MTTSHTPNQWKVDKSCHSAENFDIVRERTVAGEKDVELLATVYGDGDIEDTRNRAALIVRAVNRDYLFDQVRRALTRLLIGLDGESNPNWYDGILYDAIDETKAAIAEGFCGGESATEEERIAAWQYLIDTGLAWSLQGLTEDIWTTLPLFQLQRASVAERTQQRRNR